LSATTRNRCGLLEDAGSRRFPRPAGCATAEVRSIRVEQELYSYILSLTRRTRVPTLLLAQARAQPSVLCAWPSYGAFDGRDILFPTMSSAPCSPSSAIASCSSPSGAGGFDADRVLTDVIAAIPVPRQ